MHKSVPVDSESCLLCVYQLAIKASVDDWLLRNCGFDLSLLKTRNNMKYIVSISPLTYITSFRIIPLMEILNSSNFLRFIIEIWWVQSFFKVIARAI